MSVIYVIVLSAMVLSLAYISKKAEWTEVTARGFVIFVLAYLVNVFKQWGSTRTLEYEMTQLFILLVAVFVGCCMGYGLSLFLPKQK